MTKQCSVQKIYICLLYTYTHIPKHTLLFCRMKNAWVVINHVYCSAVRFLTQAMTTEELKIYSLVIYFIPFIIFLSFYSLIIKYSRIYIYWDKFCHIGQLNNYWQGMLKQGLQFVYELRACKIMKRLARRNAFTSIIYQKRILSCDHRSIMSYFVDFWRGQVVESISLQGIEHVLQFTAVEGKIFMRSYR